MATTSATCAPRQRAAATSSDLDRRYPPYRQEAGASLRAGTKIDRTLEITGPNANNAGQTKSLESRHRAPSGNVLREAGRPLREGAGRASLGIARRRFL